jgi:hypothetical protein
MTFSSRSPPGSPGDVRHGVVVSAIYGCRSPFMYRGPDTVASEEEWTCREHSHA